jgi:Fe-S-cluster-containing hydrogenase component 2
VILGSGNRALRFASSLLESGVPEVICVESHAQWAAKRFAGWEVEKRRFEMAGGRLIEAKPVSISEKAALLWELRLRDVQGIRVVDVARVVAAGPFRDLPGVREHPPGSFLFELEQTASETKEQDVDGWVMEEERGRWLAGKIARALASDFGDRRDLLDQAYRRARARLKRYLKHREEPFTPSYQGKWINSKEMRAIRDFSGVPREEQKKKLVASIECFEEIPCNSCQLACPEDAIRIGQVPRIEKILDESKCAGCGACLPACPSNATFMLREHEDRSFSELALVWRGAKPWNVGEFATLLNRRGDSLGSTRVIEVSGDVPLQTVKIEVPSHLLWEARAIKRAKAPEVEDDALLSAEASAAITTDKVEVTIDGEKRLIREGIPTSVALFEIGRGRPDDVLVCPDGSCNLCFINVDGIRKRACQTVTHRGMAIRLESHSDTLDTALCPCQEITFDQVVERMKQGKLRSPEAVLSVLHVGEGRCHGRLCMAAFRRVLLDQGLDASQWIDWRFPWSDWGPAHN